MSAGQALGARELYLALANASMVLRSIRYHAENGHQDRPLHVRLALIAKEANAGMEAIDSIRTPTPNTEPAGGSEVVAWMYELATARKFDGTYTDWSEPKISFAKPCVPDGSIRNLVALTAQPAGGWQQEQVEAVSSVPEDYDFWLRDAEKILRLNGTTTHAYKISEARTAITRLLAALTQPSGEQP